MEIKFYMLTKDHRVISTTDVLEWGEWFEDADRVVKQTKFNPDILVSTVFLGLDHRFGDPGPPLVFETMVFGLSPSDEDFVSRYSSWDDADTGHAATVRKVTELLRKAKVPPLQAATTKVSK